MKNLQIVLDPREKTRILGLKTAELDEGFKTGK
jgi:hypothetical protein